MGRAKWHLETGYLRLELGVREKTQNSEHIRTDTSEKKMRSLALTTMCFSGRLPQDCPIAAHKKK